MKAGAPVRAHRTPLIHAWPLLLDEGSAARFSSSTRRDFRAMVSAGVMPPPRTLLPHLSPRWHRQEIEAVMARLYNLDGSAGGEAEARGKAAALAALATFDPNTPQRPSSASGIERMAGNYAATGLLRRKVKSG